MGTTIFAEMSALAGTTGSVNLGQGFPDTDGPPEIAAAAAAAIMDGRGNQYPPGAGIPELRQAVAAHQKRFYGLDVDPDTQVLVTAGATEGIAAALIALLEPGDEAIAFEPYYDSYAASVAMAGATRVPVTLRPPDFRPDIDALRAAITGNTRLILLNTPHNPTGVVFTPDELAQIAALRSEEHTSELQSRRDLVCRLLLEKKNTHNTLSHDPFPRSNLSAPLGPTTRLGRV